MLMIPTAKAKMKEKTSHCNSRALLTRKAPTKMQACIHSLHRTGDVEKQSLPEGTASVEHHITRSDK